MTTRKQRLAKARAVERLMNNDTELLNTSMQAALEEVLEGEMVETPRAGPRRRLPGTYGRVFPCSTFAILNSSVSR